jgi:hypothetical protein
MMLAKHASGPVQEARVNGSDNDFKTELRCAEFQRSGQIDYTPPDDQRKNCRVNDLRTNC